MKRGDVLNAIIAFHLINCHSISQRNKKKKKSPGSCLSGVAIISQIELQSHESDFLGGAYVDMTSY